MTPATKAAKKAGVSFSIHQYDHDDAAASYGEEAAVLLGVNPPQVFKTLLVACTATQKLAVALVPVSHQLNLKLVAKALAFKKVTMADPKKAEIATGYVLGGISPLGQKKRLPFVVDTSVNNFNTVFVSGGRRGLEIELAPADLVSLCDATISDIKS